MPGFEVHIAYERTRDIGIEDDMAAAALYVAGLDNITATNLPVFDKECLDSIRTITWEICDHSCFILPDQVKATAEVLSMLLPKIHGFRALKGDEVLYEWIEESWERSWPGLAAYLGAVK
jgi:hypothetical protein